MRSEIDTTIHPGTKETFRGWLFNKHRLSYAEYSKLPTEAKAKIRKEYRVRYD